ncbi:tRNA adenosine(34) deaminase TadA [Parasphingorhabdus sp.]|uniref:tRNA adenosine(34) deaminase TadA n=1 Tax=Parasphingorhabdus sp. TaxID=2709688 RepID=UPI003C795605
MAPSKHTSFMDAALALAKTALTVGEIPVGAVVVQSGKIIGRGHNRTRIDHDPTAHAEIVAIREATKFLGNDRLEDCDLWVTLEPCTMCAGAIAHARIGRLYYGASDAKGGAVDSGVRFFNAPTCHHKPEVYPGMDEETSAKLLTGFFKGRRG